eukprot:jgi/Picsp_1/5107/NSC_02470-R1_hypothetical protein CHLREDRAFT_184667 [Chlamydomonas reinhardtii]
MSSQEDRSRILQNIDNLRKRTFEEMRESQEIQCLKKELRAMTEERDALKAKVASYEAAFKQQQAQQQDPNAVKEGIPLKSPEQLSASVDRMTQSIYRMLSKSMVWRPSCKRGGARLSVELPNVTLQEYRALVGEEKYAHATKGKKSQNKTVVVSAKTEDDIANILDNVPSASVRYGGSLEISLAGQGLRFLYNKESRQLTVAGSYKLAGC